MIKATNLMAISTLLYSASEVINTSKNLAGDDDVLNELLSKIRSDILTCRLIALKHAERARKEQSI